MDADPLEGLDLNLLRTLDVLLEERSVTRAAAVLGRSQPAVSHALGRLREALGDPLLVRQGRSLAPTPRAEALAGPLRGVLQALRRSLVAGTFDPATSRRTFTVASPALLAPVVPDLLAALGEAPGVRIELTDARGPGALERAELQLDVLPEAAPGVVARPLGTVTTAVLLRRGHPALADWGLEAWLGWPHVLVRTREGDASPVDRAIAAEGRRREIGLAVADLLLVPHVVARTDLLFNGPEQLLRLLAAPLGLVLVPPPLPLPAARVAALWPERLSGIPATGGCRERCVAVLAALLA
ncbi:MAG: LysR family transcriptional regulator [Myxococcota bacterium]